MSSYSNFQSKNMKHDKDRSNRYESDFQTAVEFKYETNIIKRYLPQWVEFAAVMRWMPDVYYDMITPKEGLKIKLDLYQRVMMRVLSRFTSNYFTLPRGSAKTLIEIMVLYHTAIMFPNITLSITATTKESAVKIWRDKHNEIVKFYPSIFDEIKHSNFAKDSASVEFQNGSIIDNLANSQSSKGLRRVRGSLEEAALIDKDLYEDAIEPIFNVPRTTMSGDVDPTELNGSINRFSTSGKFCPAV